MSRKHFEKRIIEESKLKNINGYVQSNNDNLIDGVTLDLFKDDLAAGSGNELESKFNALFSSSALAVNSFALVKKLPTFSIFEETDFTKINFERQFKTGLGGAPPNLDFTLENENTIIAFESKYLECLEKKKVHFVDSYKKSNLKYLGDFWFDLIDSYKSENLYLDVSQLIKHSIGLINQAKGKKITLVYIYWTPLNKEDYQEYKIHQKELNLFSDRMKKQSDIMFKSLSYDELWSIYDTIPEFKNYSKRLRERYRIKI